MFTLGAICDNSPKGYFPFHFVRKILTTTYISITKKAMAQRYFLLDQYQGTTTANTHEAHAIKIMFRIDISFFLKRSGGEHSLINSLHILK